MNRGMQVLMQFHDQEHCSQVLSELRKQQTCMDFCDVSLEVEGGKVIPAHRTVLAACSDYFRALFTSGFQDSNSGRYRIPNCSFEAIEKVVQFLYSGSIEINNQLVEEILRVADFLCVFKLKNYCSATLRAAISDENCMNVKFLAEQYDLEDLLTEVVDYITPRFSALIANPEILEMPFEFVHRLLSDTRLNHISEDKLVDLVLRWISHDEDSRRQFTTQLMGVIELEYLPQPYIKDLILGNTLVTSGLSSEYMNKIRDLSERTANPRDLDDIVLCRSRSVKPGDEVQVLCYFIRESRWMTLKQPDRQCWHGLESMCHHQGYLFLLVSQTVDMYGYMHHAPETKHLLMADFRKGLWQKLQGPSTVRVQCRLVSHVNGLYVVDRYGLVEEFHQVSSTWRASGSPGFEDYPNATLYVLPMPADRYIYVLRGFSGGCSFSYAQMSFSLHVFDTVRHTWECLSDIDAGDLDLADHERFHGYSVSPGRISFMNEIGQQRIAFDLENRNWSSCSPENLLPKHVAEVWGSVSHQDKVYFVGQSQDESPIFMMYDHGRRRLKEVTKPPGHLSGLLCHMLVPSETLAQMTAPLDSQLGDLNRN